jgi:hypothetical protein
MITQAKRGRGQDRGADGRLKLVEFGLQGRVLATQIDDQGAVRAVVAGHGDRAGKVGHGRFLGTSPSGPPSRTPSKKVTPVGFADEGE